MGGTFSVLFPVLWSTRNRRSDYATYRKTSHNGIVVAIIGRTGSGMSQFIHDATGSYEAGVSPELDLTCEPYTATIQDYGFTVPGIDFVDFPLIFIDTPGYDFKANHDNEYSTLRKLLSWLKDFKPCTELDGLIFMHNITTNEIKDRQFLPDPILLSDLCGEAWAKKTVLVTTHWDQLEPDSIDPKREEISTYWSSMLRSESTTKSYGDRNRTSAWKILQPLIEVAEAAREARLKQELDKLEGVLPKSTLGTVKSVLDQKAKLIHSIIARIGEKIELTDEEEMAYSNLNKEAQALWEGLEKEIDSEELEQHFATARTRSASENKLDNADLVFLVMGPAGSRTALFAEVAAGLSKRSSLLDIPKQFRKSDIRVRRTTISQRQAVFIVPQEFDGVNVKETHVVRGTQKWLSTEDSCQDHPYVDYVLFLSQPTNPLRIQLESPFRYLNDLRDIFNIKDLNPLPYKNKVSFIATIGPNDGNSRVEVPDAWETFVKPENLKGCPTYTFDGTSESARSILSKIMG